MTGDRDEERGSGSEERRAYLRVGVVFLVSCLLAAGGVALYDAGGLSSLFGPRLADYDDGPPPEVEERPQRRAPAGRKTPRVRPGRRSGEKTAPKQPVSEPAASAEPAPETADGTVSDPVPAPVADLGNGRLIVRCSQPCRVTIDGAIVGEASPVLKMIQPAGDHQVKVEELDGDDLATKRVLVAPNRDREISFRLGAKPPVKDFFDKLKGTEEWEQ